MDHARSRRAFLSLVALATTTGLTGCSSGSDSSVARRNRSNGTETRTRTRSASPSEPTDSRTTAIPEGGPPELQFEAKEKTTLTIVSRNPKTGEETWNRTITLEFGTTKTLVPEAHEDSGYDVSIEIDDEVKWTDTLGTGVLIYFVVTESGEVDVEERYQE
jgi:hypothetical protein